MEYYLEIKKGNLLLCNSVDGPGQHYTKWNKPVRESIICFHSYVESNEENKLTTTKWKTNSENWVAAVRGVAGLGEKGERIKQKKFKRLKKKKKCQQTNY